MLPFLLTVALMVVLYFSPGHTALRLEREGGGLQIDVWTLYVVPSPLILLAPFTAGLTKITRNYAREDHAFVWSDFWEAVKDNWKAFLLNGLIFYCAAAVLSLAMLYYYTRASFSFLNYVPFGLALLVSLLLLWMEYYVPVMLVTFDLKLRQVYRNAAIFILAGFWRNAVITGVFLALGILVWSIPISGYSIPVYLALIALWVFYFISFLVNYMVYPVIDQYLIRPQNAPPEPSDPEA